MTQEEEQLLLKDLCARLPYGVKINIRNDYTLTMEDMEFNAYHLATASYDFEYRNLRPYLRPMSSMTDEERDEFRTVGGVMSHNVQNDTWAISAFTPEAYDWLNEHHFDWRGLIPMGLALEAPVDMYNLNVRKEENK